MSADLLERLTGVIVKVQRLHDLALASQQDEISILATDLMQNMEAAKVLAARLEAVAPRRPRLELRRGIFFLKEDVEGHRRDVPYCVFCLEVTGDLRPLEGPKKIREDARHALIEAAMHLGVIHKELTAATRPEAP